MPLFYTITTSKFCLLTIGTLKNAAESSWILKILVLALAYMEPIRNMYHVVALAIMINFVVGIWKSRKVLKEKFNSGKAWKTIEKTGLFTMYIMIIYFFEMEVIMSTDIYVSRTLCGILIMAECRSIGENGDAILGTNIFSSFFKTLASSFNKKQSIDESK